MRGSGEEGNRAGGGSGRDREGKEGRWDGGRVMEREGERAGLGSERGGEEGSGRES